VTRQNAEFSTSAGKLHAGNFFAQQLPLRRDDDELDGFGKRHVLLYFGLRVALHGFSLL
jgi:hypothetical protein